MKFHYLILFTLSIQIISCTSDKVDSENAIKTAKVDWEEVSLDSTIRENIEQPTIETFTLSKVVKQDEEVIAVFEVTSENIKEDTLGKKIINLEVNEWLRSNFYINEDDYKVKSLDTLIARYERFLKTESKSIGFEMSWEMNAGAKVVYSKNGLITYELGNYSFTGGAHGNGSIKYRSYDIITGSRLGLDALFSDTTEVLSILNKSFLKYIPKETRDELFDDRIPLTKNILLGKDSLTFYYNPYEIGPYVVGPIEVKVAVSEFAKLLKVKLN